MQIVSNTFASCIMTAKGCPNKQQNKQNLPKSINAIQDVIALNACLTVLYCKLQAVFKLCLQSNA